MHAPSTVHYKYKVVQNTLHKYWQLDTSHKQGWGKYQINTVALYYTNSLGGLIYQGTAVYILG